MIWYDMTSVSEIINTETQIYTAGYWGQRIRGDVIRSWAWIMVDSGTISPEFGRGTLMQIVVP